MTELLEHVPRGCPRRNAGQLHGQRSDGRLVRSAVVVEHDHDRAVRRGRRCCSAPPSTSHRSTHRRRPRPRDPPVSRDRRARTPWPDRRHTTGAVDACEFSTSRERSRPARDSPTARRLAQPVESDRPAGEHLVDVRLVAGVPDDRRHAATEDPVQRDRQLDDAQVGAEVAPGHRLTDAISSDLISRIPAGRVRQVHASGRPGGGPDRCRASSRSTAAHAPPTARNDSRSEPIVASTAVGS